MQVNVIKHESYGDAPAGAGQIHLTGGFTFGYIYSENGEVEGYCTKPNGQFISELHGWYRTTDPEVAVQTAVDWLANNI
jgi:hypothetical protein